MTAETRRTAAPPSVVGPSIGDKRPPRNVQSLVGGWHDVVEGGSRRIRTEPRFRRLEENVGDEVFDDFFGYRFR